MEVLTTVRVTTSDGNYDETVILRGAEVKKTREVYEQAVGPDIYRKGGPPRITITGEIVTKKE